MTCNLFLLKKNHVWFSIGTRYARCEPICKWLWIIVYDNVTIGNTMSIVYDSLIMSDKVSLNFHKKVTIDHLVLHFFRDYKLLKTIMYNWFGVHDRLFAKFLKFCTILNVNILCYGPVLIFWSEHIFQSEPRSQHWGDLSEFWWNIK